MSKEMEKIFKEITNVSNTAYSHFPSQIVIDIIEDVEELEVIFKEGDVLSSTGNRMNELIGSQVYHIDNVLEIIDDGLLWDIYLLETLKDILNRWEELL